MGFFDELLSPVTSVVKSATRLTASSLAVVLAVPVALVEEAIAAGCETTEEVKRYIRRQ